MKEQKRKLKKRYLSLSFILICLILLTLFLYIKTGFFFENIDEKDKNTWEFNDGIIKSAHEYEINGSRDIRWLLIHGYASSPKDFNELSLAIKENFSEYIKVPRLKGHGELPSKIVSLSIKDWYSQMEQEYLLLNETCEKVNIVGFSMGGTITLKLAEKYQLNNVYVVSPYLNLRYKWFKLFTLESYIDLIAEPVTYIVKSEVAQINSEQGKKEHVGYITMPLVPVKRSFYDINQVKQNLSLITEPILIQHSKNDDVIDFQGSKDIYNSVSSSNKKLIEYKKSNHVILRDFDKDEVIKNIIEFEKSLR